MGIAIINLQNKIPVSESRIKGIVSYILSKEGKASGDVSVTISTDVKIRKLNKRFLKKDTSTDVLAFSFIEGRSPEAAPKRLLGDIVVSADTAIANAKIYKMSVRQELYLYVIHGLLHLLGYDDTTKAKKDRMRKRQDKYFKNLILRTKR